MIKLNVNISDLETLISALRNEIEKGQDISTLKNSIRVYDYLDGLRKEYVKENPEPNYFGYSLVDDDEVPF